VSDRTFLNRRVRLARISDRVVKITEGLQNLTGGLDGKSGEINEAARSFRTLSNNLDKRTAEITAGVNRFTNSRAHEIEVLSTDAPLRPVLGRDGRLSADSLDLNSKDRGGIVKQISR